MENIILAVHLILALGLIAVVLLQRSEGGGLGMGGGGGAVSGRAAATALSKATWFFAIGFMITSLTLTVLAQRTSGGSVIDGLDGIQAESPAVEGGAPTLDPNAILVPDLGALSVPLPTTDEPASE